MAVVVVADVAAVVVPVSVTKVVEFEYVVVVVVVAVAAAAAAVETVVAVAAPLLLYAESSIKNQYGCLEKKKEHGQSIQRINTLFICLYMLDSRRWWQSYAVAFSSCHFLFEN